MKREELIKNICKFTADNPKLSLTHLEDIKDVFLYTENDICIYVVKVGGRKLIYV